MKIIAAGCSQKSRCPIRKRSHGIRHATWDAYPTTSVWYYDPESGWLFAYIRDTNLYLSSVSIGYSVGLLMDYALNLDLTKKPGR